MNLNGQYRRPVNFCNKWKSLLTRNAQKRKKAEVEKKKKTHKNYFWNHLSGRKKIAKTLADGRPLLAHHIAELSHLHQKQIVCGV